jgi:PAS fold
MAAVDVGQEPGTLIRTPEGHITFWSPQMERRYGFLAQEALGQMSHELLKPSHWRSLSEIEAVLLERSEWSGGLILHRADGRPIMTANYWHLHQGVGGVGTLVTEVHTDIVSPATSEGEVLADVVTTIAQELSEPLTALGGFVSGAQRAVRPVWPDRAMLDRGLAEATAQLARAGEILGRVRALGETLRDPRLRELHSRIASAMANAERATRAALVARTASIEIRRSAIQRALLQQNIEVFRRRLAVAGSGVLDAQSERLLRQLLAEEEHELSALENQDAAGS